MALDKYLAIRLLKLFDYLKDNRIISSQREFCSGIGITDSFFTEIKKGRSGISPDKLQNIQEKYAKYQQWLITGNNAPIELNQHLVVKEDSATYDKNTSGTYIPLIPTEAIAGFANGDVAVLDYEILSRYTIPDFEGKADFLIRTRGSSMMPTYFNGDLLACKKINEITFIQWGKVYVMDTIQGPLVKRLYENPLNGDQIICHSDNKEMYPRFILAKSDIRSLSIVIGSIRFE